MHQELLQLAEAYIAKWDTMTKIHEDKPRNYEARQVWEDGVPLTIIKYRADGLKIEQFRGFFDDPVPIQTTINKRISGERLEDDEGHEMWHMKVTSPAPMLVAHRSTIICYYRKEEDDGSLCILNSSLGNDQI